MATFVWNTHLAAGSTKAKEIDVDYKAEFLLMLKEEYVYAVSLLANEAFYSIITGKTIRLSALALSNDSREGQVGKGVIEGFAAQHGLSQYTTSQIMEALDGSALALMDSEMAGGLDALSFCLSEEGDLLSQWRGYTNDASGISIGFSKMYLDQCLKYWLDNNEMQGELEKIIYDLDETKRMLFPKFRSILEYIEGGAFLNPLLDGPINVPFAENPTDDQISERTRVHMLSAQARMYILELHQPLYRFKGSAFSEEREWRVSTTYLKSTINSNIKFRASGDRIIPYQELGHL